MGWNTTIVFLNDALSELKEDLEIGPRLADAILRVPMSTFQGIDVRVGNHVNAMHVVEAHHADQLLPVLVGGNVGVAVKDAYVHYASKTPELDLLKSLAKSLGYDLRKRHG